MGLLAFTACSSDPDPESSANTSALKVTIQKAYDASYGVKEAANASDVAEGLNWVTKTEMNALNTAIRSAETARDSRSSQSVVDAARATLESAIAVFNTAKQKTGTAAAITLSGTITITNNGQPVPYIEVRAYGDNWNWQEWTRVASSEANAPWSITANKAEIPSEISFRVFGYAEDTYSTRLYTLDVKDPYDGENLTIFVDGDDIDDIAIVMHLNLITLSGTISGRYNGNPVPYVVMQVVKKDDGAFLGETEDILNVGSNRPWSIIIDSLEVHTEIMFSVWGHTDRWGGGEELFLLWGQEFGISKAQRTVKNQNKSGLNINFGNVRRITLSGTINVTCDGEPVPYLQINALQPDDEWESNEWGSRAFYERGDIIFRSTGNSTSWSMKMEPFATNTKLIFLVCGSSSRANIGDLFWWWSDEIDPPIILTVKDQNISNIALNLGNIEPWGSWE
jgi:hypothetical protein